VWTDSAPSLPSTPLWFRVCDRRWLSMYGDGEMPQGPWTDERGLVMKVEGAEFRPHEQLSKLNRDRLSKKGLKPIERIDFSDLRVCNRDHLRTYCAVYEMKRKEKDQMERDMARYVAAWHHGEPGYDIADYKPASVRQVFTPQAAALMPRVSSRTPTPASVLTTPGRLALSADASRKRQASTTPEADPDLLRTAAARPETRTIKRARLATPPTTPSRAAKRSVPSSSTLAPRAQADPAAPAANFAPAVPAPAQARSASAAAPPRMVAIPPPRPPPAPAVPAPASAAASVPLTMVQQQQLLQMQLQPHLPSAPQVGTSFKQYAHAQQAEQRYKAAYNGGGAAIVQVVENAAAYFEGRDTSDVKLNKRVSYDRYQFNVDILSEIFDGPPLPDTGSAPASALPAAPSAATNGTAMDVDGDTLMAGVTPLKPHPSRGTAADGPAKVSAEERRKAVVEGVMQRVADSMNGRSAGDRADQLIAIEQAHGGLAKSSDGVEKIPLHTFGKLERARTVEEVDAARLEFEKDHNIRFVEGASTVVKRRLATDAPLFTPTSALRIIKFGE
jgi:hypothetical protein